MNNPQSATIYRMVQATKEIYLGDEYGTRLAETSVNIEAREEA